jgi:protein-tyrosine phosphatase
MRLAILLLPLAALASLAACEQAVTPVEPAAQLSPVAANAIALEDERRVLDLEGGVNFRDLGGYRTADGRVTKWEVLYRAGSPAGLTAKDQAELTRRGIRTVCDFRTTEERAAEPNPFAQGNSAVTYWTRDYANAMGDLGAVLTGPGASAEKSRAALIAGYRTMPFEHAESLRAMFGYLAQGQVPLAFNCSAGKDRTGIAAALVLSLLGVPRETVVADYALSDDIVDYRAQMEESAAKNPAYGFLTQLPWEVVEPLLASDPAYIEAALDAIAAKHGSVDGFIENELGVTPAMKTAIVENLTEPA